MPARSRRHPRRRPQENYALAYVKMLLTIVFFTGWLFGSIMLVIEYPGKSLPCTIGLVLLTLWVFVVMGIVFVKIMRGTDNLFDEMEKEAIKLDRSGFTQKFLDGLAKETKRRRDNDPWGIR